MLAHALSALEPSAAFRSPPRAASTSKKLRLAPGGEVDKDAERYVFILSCKADPTRQSQAPSAATLRPCLREAEAAILVLRVRYSECGAFIAQTLRLRMELRKDERERDTFADEIRRLCHG